MQHQVIKPELLRTPTPTFSFYKGTILDLFSQQVAKRPQHLALKMGETLLSYKDFDQKTDELAKYLRKRGVGRDSLVALILPRSPEMILSIFAILKAGGAYVPMGPKDGEQRIQHILKDSGCKVLITQEDIKNQLNCDYGHTILDVSLNRKDWFSPLEEENIIERDISDFPVRIDPASLAYVIYTSGTTGKPKGALIEHRNLQAVVDNFLPRVHYGDRVLQSMNTTCDSSVIEIFPTLCHGASLILWEKDLSATIKKEKITFTCLTPSMTDLLNTDDCLSLEKITIAGEKLTKEAVNKMPAHTKVYNGYGPTECSVAGSCTLIEDGKNIHIGGILDHVKTYVVKSDLTLCKTGEPGELLIGGTGVARGYFNRPKLTSEKFIPNPFGPGRLYRTGDLVRWKNSLELDFLGRIDRQVKVRGFRVELDGVEKVISNFPGVNQSFVKYNQKNLIAFLSPENIDVLALKQFLQEELAAYAVPTQIFTLDKFPINASGKVDELKLPQQNINTEDLPLSKMDREMAKSWEDVLFKERHPISLLDNFFDLGGNSIDAMKLTKAMQERYHPDFPLELIYQNPVLKDFIEVARKERGKSTHRLRDEKTPWPKIFMDALKSMPSMIYFYMSYSLPSFIFLAIFIFNPIFALSLVLLEFLIHRFFKFPDTYFFRRIKLFMEGGDWKYNSIKIIEDYPLEKISRSVFAIHPHGITEDHIYLLEKHLLKKRIKYKILNHEALFKIPFSKTILTLLAGLPADESSYFRAEKENFSLIVTPGDIPEGFRAEEEGAIALSTQKHFFKYILQTGTALTPVYVHNNHQAFKLFSHFFQQRYNWFKKSRIMVLQPYWGRWFLPIPFKVDLLITTGTPLEVEKIENPSWQQVEDIYTSYLKHLEGFHKKYTPSEATKLKFY